MQHVAATATAIKKKLFLVSAETAAAKERTKKESSREFPECHLQVKVLIKSNMNGNKYSSDKIHVCKLLVVMLRLGVERRVRKRDDDP